MNTVTSPKTAPNQTPKNDAMAETDEHQAFSSADNTKKALVCAKEEPIIDIAQVMVANQVLLKNITRRMESLENHVKTLERALTEARQHMELTTNQRLLLAAPPRPVVPWRSDAPQVDDRYLSRFSWWERFFVPERMRRSIRN